MESTVCYITVRIEVDYDENLYSEDEAVQEAISQCDYGFDINREELKITGTEICGIND